MITPAIPPPPTTTINATMIEATDRTTGKPAPMIEQSTNRNKSTKPTSGAPTIHEPPLQLAYAACSDEHTHELQVVFGGYVQLLHHSAYEVIERNDLITVGLMLSPRRDGSIWDTTLVSAQGEPDIDNDLLEALQAFWPTGGNAIAADDPSE